MCTCVCVCFFEGVGGGVGDLQYISSVVVGLRAVAGLHAAGPRALSYEPDFPVLFNQLNVYIPLSLLMMIKRDIAQRSPS